MEWAFSWTIGKTNIGSVGNFGATVLKQSISSQMKSEPGNRLPHHNLYADDCNRPQSATNTRSFNSRRAKTRHACPAHCRNARQIETKRPRKHLGKNVDFLYKNRFPSLIETSDRSSSNSSGQQSNTAALAGMIVLGLVWPYIVSNGNGGGELENNRGHLRRQKPPRRWRFGIPG